MLQATGAILGVVEEDRQGKAPLVEAVSSDDSQLPQRNLLKMVHGDEDVAGHLADCLEERKRKGSPVKLANVQMS